MFQISAAETFAGSPRAGHSRDVSLLLDNATSYTKGLLPGAISLGVVFFMIAFAMATAKCCRVGLVSGKPLSTRQSRVVRPLFIGLGTLFIVGAILLVSHGLTDLQDTVTILQQSASDVQDIAAEADMLVNTVLADVRAIARPTRAALERELTSQALCPADPSLAGVDTAQDLLLKAEDARSMLQQLDELDQVDEIEDGVQLLNDAANGLAEATGAVDLTAWHALLILIPLTILPTILVAATILVHHDVDLPVPCVLYWLLVPIFVLLVIICSVAAALLLPLITANSDLCLPPSLSSDSYPANTPDTTTLRVLDRLGYSEPTNSVRAVTDYYLSACPADTPHPLGDWTTDRLPALVESQLVLDQLAGTLEPILAPLSLHCNREYDALVELVEDMQGLVAVLVEALERTQTTVACETWVPLYQRILYEGACTNSIRALLFLFACTLSLAVLGWTMIGLRSAVQPVQFK